MSLFSLSACDRQNYRNYLQSNMKFTSLLLMVPLVAAHGFLGRWPGNIDNSTVPEECCCLTYKASCTMNTERMFHVKLFYNRKKGTTPEEFNDYWANKHAALAANFHLRLGVVKYAQVCTNNLQLVKPSSFVPGYLTSCVTTVPLHTGLP